MDGKLTRGRADFLAGQYFDIRVEVHAPVNGSEGLFSSFQLKTQADANAI